MLSGIRIVEFEGLGPAPFAGMLLADLGAEVIVVHRPKPVPPDPRLTRSGAKIL
ncbi:MAG: CoA transferase, partial [Pseudomonadota bacterium]